MTCLCSCQTKEALLLALSTVSDGLFVKHAFSSSVMPMTTQIGICPDKNCDRMIIPRGIESRVNTIRRTRLACLLLERITWLTCSLYLQRSGHEGNSSLPHQDILRTKAPLNSFDVRWAHLYHHLNHRHYHRHTARHFSWSERRVGR